MTTFVSLSAAERFATAAAVSELDPIYQSRIFRSRALALRWESLGVRRQLERVFLESRRLQDDIARRQAARE